MDGNRIITEASNYKPDMKFFIHTGSLDYVMPDNLKALGLTNDSIIYKPIRDMEMVYNKIESSIK